MARTVIPQPIAKVNTRHIDLVKLLPPRGASHRDEEERVFDVSMAPWNPLARVYVIRRLGDDVTVRALDR